MKKRGSGGIVNSLFAKKAERISFLFINTFFLILIMAIILPSFVNALSTSNPTPSIKVTFPEEVTLINASLFEVSTNENTSLTLVSNAANKVFTFKPSSELTEGDYQFDMYAEDFLGNIGKTTQTFTVNFSFVVELVIPPYGRTQTADFPVRFSTSQNATCRYDFILEQLFSDYRQFDLTSETTHKLNQFSLNTPNFDGDNFFVICNTTYGTIKGNDGAYQFSFTLDNTPPTITSISASPNPVSQCIYPNPSICALYSTLSVSTDELARCRYDANIQDFSLMENDFVTEKLYYSTENVVNLTFSSQGTYNYYVACEDQTYPALSSSTQQIQIVVNTTIPLQITSTGPSGYTSADYVQLTATTNKISDCRYYRNSTLIGTAFGYTSHSVTYSNSDTGAISFVVDCTTLSETATSTISFTSDKTPPVFSYVNDSSSFADPQKTNDNTKLRVKFLAVDPESDIDFYEYRIENSTGNPVTNWYYANSGGSWITVNNLNLSDGLYKFRVNATNNVGLTAVTLSDKIYVDIFYEPITNPTCTDSIQNQYETDVDCGGPYCNALNKTCGANKKCSSNVDCVTGYCNSTNKICVQNPCDNNALDKWYGETDVDCGGSYCIQLNKTCGANKKCSSNVDCVTGYCNPLHVCTTPSCSDGYKNGNEAGADCGGSCITKCSIGTNCVTDSDCISDNCLNYICRNSTTTGNTTTNNTGGGNEIGRNLDSDGDGIPDWWEIEHGLNRFVKDSGTIDPLTGKPYLETYTQDENGNSGGTGNSNTTPGGFSFVIFFIILLIVGGLVIGGYYVYATYYKKEEKKTVLQNNSRNSILSRTSSGMPSGMPPSRTPSGIGPAARLPASGKPSGKPVIKSKPLSPKIMEMLLKKRQEREKQRTNVFGFFDSGKKETSNVQRPSQGLGISQNILYPISRSAPQLKKISEPEKEKAKDPSEDWVPLEKVSTKLVPLEKISKNKGAKENSQQQAKSGSSIFDQIADFAGFGKETQDASRSSKSSNPSKSPDDIFEELRKESKKKKK